MKNSLKSTLVAVVLFSCSTAFAGVSDGKAYTVCKQSVKGIYGSDSTVRLLKIRSASAGSKNVKLRVRANGEKVVLKCGVDKAGSVLALTDADGLAVAGFASKAQ